MSAVTATGLSKRYGRRRRWALKDCTLEIPEGRALTNRLRSSINL